MKYSILLFGKNNVVMDEFFIHLGDVFECLSTSNRAEDIMNHLKYYAPDALVCCLNQETKENAKQVITVKDKLKKANIPIIIIGSEEDCTDFFSYSGTAVAQLVLTRPLTINAISEQIITFLNEKKKREEEERRLEEEKKREEERKREEDRRKREEKKKKSDEKRHILIVDDDPLMLKMIKENLSKEYNVATAISGKVALKFLENKTTDLILLDYEMPVENGAVVLQKLHDNEATRDIPVVFLTGVTEKRKIQKALELKPQGYLLKPIDHTKLEKIIDKLLK